MELTKHDSQIIKGVAIIGMVMLHLFCRLDELPYLPLIWIGKVPMVYYLGLLGDMCVPMFCFCSGYAHFLLGEELGKKYKKWIPEKMIHFMCNYWIVLLLFTAASLLFGKQDIIPKSGSEFLGNIFLYNLSYNGAWWFILTYIILLLLSPILVNVVNKFTILELIAGSSVIYFIAYLLRFKILIELQNPILDWFMQQSILVGTSQYGYIIGMIFRKNRWVSSLRQQLTRKGVGGGTVCLIIIALMITFIAHCVVQSAFFAPFTAVVTLIALFQIKLPKKIEGILTFLGKHSTNIWLVHMFFYLTLFDGLVFAAKYPILIIVAMFVLCIVVSIFVNIVYRLICKWIDNIKWI